MSWTRITLAGALAGLTGLCVAASVQADAPGEDATRFFTAEVRPILEQKCVSCHSGDKPQGNLRLTTREGLLTGGAGGPAVTLDRPQESRLIRAVNYQGRRMPPQGKLAQKEIDTLTRWVQSGLAWPSGEAANLEPKAHHGPPPVNAETMKFWSYQPVKRPAVPGVKNRAWVRTPIDAFILAKLEANGLKPNPTAGRPALIRRACYDLTGLPPSPEEVRAFAADTSPNAWEKVVDRLLASPQYGEKWGRHWLDLVRYAESNSYERDGTKEFAWRYRDYVINSLNADKPYDQFITEQIAGDELWATARKQRREAEAAKRSGVRPISTAPNSLPRVPSRAECLIATGYYRLGIWDDEPVDPEQAIYDDLDDVATTTGQVFLGMTINCARCHDHKLDPIPQKDYYRFLSFFNGIRRFGVRSTESVLDASYRPIGTGEEQKRAGAEQAAYEQRVQDNQKRIDAVEARIAADLKGVEVDEWKAEPRRLAIARTRVPAKLSQEEFDRYASLLEERRTLRRSPPRYMEMAMCVTEVGPQPRDTYVLMRGNAHAHGDRVEPGFPSVLAPPQPQLAGPTEVGTCGRRLALARWLSSPQNPLTARVMVNRIWQYHFGRGIVRTPNDFGFQGAKPTHPELLDWLASEFVRQGWHMKPLHRLILLSNAYKMSSAANAAGLKKDPENGLFWRFDMRRLQAEEVRDSILAANGSLNLKMGGPSIYPTLPNEVLAGQSMPGAGWGKSSLEEQSRRSVYIFVKRSLSVPIIAGFDGADTDATCPVRFATTQPTQALGMINSAWINEQAKVFAAYLRKKGGDEPGQVKLALWRVLQHEPAAAEVNRGVRLIDSLRKDEKLNADEALTAFCLVALNLNEFIYLD